MLPAFLLVLSAAGLLLLYVRAYSQLTSSAKEFVLRSFLQALLLGGLVFGAVSAVDHGLTHNWSGWLRFCAFALIALGVLFAVRAALLAIAEIDGSITQESVRMRNRVIAAAAFLLFAAALIAMRYW